MVKFLSGFLFIFLYAAAVHAQEINVSAAADTTDYEVGDFIYYTIRAEHDKGIKVSQPSIEDSLKKIEIIRREDPAVEEMNGKKITTFKFILAKYDSSNVTINGIPIIYQKNDDTNLQTIYTNPVSFTVHTLQIVMEEEIKDVKEPITIPLNWKTIAMWILIGLIIIGILYFIYIKYIKKKEEDYVVEKIVHIPPYEKTLNALSELEQKRLWQKGQIKEYHTTITEIIRRYFEEQFFLPALELPTSEVIEHLQNRKESENIIEITENFLNNADLVKFAKFQPLNPVNEKMMVQAVEIVKKTMPKQKIEFKQEAADVK